MVVLVGKHDDGGDEYLGTERPGGARYQPGAGTHKLIPNRHAQVTVEVGPPMMPIGSVAGRRMANYLQGPTPVAGEIVLGTNVVAAPRTNDGWLRGGAVASYDGPIVIAGNPTYGRGEADSHGNVPVPRWFPGYPNDIAVEDRS